MGATVIGGLLLTVYLQGHELKQLRKVAAEYEVFKETTRKLGEEAETKRLAELERQRRSHERSLKALEARVARANARADELCKSAGLSAGCRALPPTPDTARPADDTGFNERLLEVLRHAQTLADRLEELQRWVNDNLVKT